jgi:ABC-type sugar transport system substrate-binding protein
MSRVFKTAGLVLAFLLCAGLVFAGGAKETKLAAGAAGRGTVALMWGGTDAPFVGPHIRSFTDTMEKAEYNVVVVDSKWDPAKQSTDVDDMIAMKVDLICIVPIDPVAIIPALKKAKESGVPVMTIATEADKSANEYIVGFSGVGAYEQGLVATELLIEAMDNKGNLAVVEGLSGFSVCVLYAKALDDTIKQKNARISVLAVQPTNWSPAEATKVTEDYITRFKNMDAIFAHDDYLAGGVIVALKEAGFKPGQVKIVGVGGTGDALQAIKEGWMYGTVLQSPITEGEFEARRALEYLQTRKLDPFYKIIDNPKIDASNVNNYKAEF